MYITVKLLIYSSFSARTAWYVNVRSKFLCIVTVSGYLYLMFCKLRYYYTVHLMDQINDIWNTCYICLHSPSLCWLKDFTMYSLQKLLYYFHFSKHNLVVRNLSFTCLRWKGNFFNKTFCECFSWTINHWPLQLECLHHCMRAFTASCLGKEASTGLLYVNLCIGWKCNV